MSERAVCHLDQTNDGDRHLHRYLILAARKYPHAFRLSPETQAALDAWRARKGLQSPFPVLRTLSMNSQHNVDGKDGILTQVLNPRPTK